MIAPTVMRVARLAEQQHWAQERYEAALEACWAVPFVKMADLQVLQRRAGKQEGLLIAALNDCTRKYACSSRRRLETHEMGSPESCPNVVAMR